MKETRVRSLIWIPHAAEELNLSTTTIEPVLWAGEPQLLKCTWPRFHRLQQEKPPQWEACTPQLESNPRSPQLEKSLCSSKGPAEPEINKLIKNKKKVQKKKSQQRHILRSWKIPPTPQFPNSSSPPLDLQNASGHSHTPYSRSSAPGGIRVERDGGLCCLPLPKANNFCKFHMNRWPMNTFQVPIRALQRGIASKGPRGLSFTVFPVTPQVELKALYYILRASALKSAWSELQPWLRHFLPSLWA